MGISLELKVFVFISVGILSTILTSAVVLVVLVCRLRIKKNKKHKELMSWKRRMRQEWMQNEPYFSNHFYRKRSRQSSSGYSSKRTNCSLYIAKPQQSIPLMKKGSFLKTPSSLPLPSDSFPNLFHLSNQKSKASKTLISTNSSNFNSQKSYKNTNSSFVSKAKFSKNTLEQSFSKNDKKYESSPCDDFTVNFTDDSGYSPTTDLKPHSFNSPSFWLAYPFNKSETKFSDRK